MFHVASSCGIAVKTYNDHDGKSSAPQLRLPANQARAALPGPGDRVDCCELNVLQQRASLRSAA
jgi:hypothetical protein